MLILARILIGLLSLLPLALLHALATPLAALARLRQGRKDRIVANNLALAFPELDASQRQQLARAHRREMIRLILELGAVWHWSERRLSRHIEVSGEALLAEAVAEGRGVLLLGGHLGNWEVLTLYTSMRVPLAALYRAPSHAAWQQAITQSRERFGGRLIASGSPAMRGLLRQLRQGAAAGLLFDQQPKQGEGVFVPLFGQPALTMTLPWRLVQRTGCRVILADCTRRAGRGWQVRYRPAPEAVYERSAETALSALNDWLADTIREHPEQYLWRYKRFSLQPEGLPDPYRTGD